MRSEFSNHAGEYYNSFKYLRNFAGEIHRSNLKQHKTTVDDLNALCSYLPWCSNAVKQFLNDVDAIEKAYSLFADDASRSLYLREIAFPLYRAAFGDSIAHQLSAHPAEMMMENQSKQLLADGRLDDILEGQANFPEGKVRHLITYIFLLEQYRYENPYLDIPVNIDVAADDVCYDIGACLGETAIWMCRKGASKVYAVKMMPENAEYLKRNIAKHHLENRVEICQTALSDTAGQTITVNNDPEFISRSSIVNLYSQPSHKHLNDPCDQVNVVTNTLDSYFSAKLPPDFIKMDIEGAEQACLRGASTVISRAVPKLAISVYHKYEDLYQIPLMIHSFCSDYKFYLKTCDRYGECVMFAQR